MTDALMNCDVNLFIYCCLWCLVCHAVIASHLKASRIYRFLSDVRYVCMEMRQKCDKKKWRNALLF